MAVGSIFFFLEKNVNKTKAEFWTWLRLTIANVSFAYLNIKIEENVCVYLTAWGRDLLPDLRLCLHRKNTRILMCINKVFNTQEVPQ